MARPRSAWSLAALLLALALPARGAPAGEGLLGRWELERGPRGVSGQLTISREEGGFAVQRQLERVRRGGKPERRRWTSRAARLRGEVLEVELVPASGLSGALRPGEPEALAARYQRRGELLEERLADGARARWRRVAPAEDEEDAEDEDAEDEDANGPLARPQDWPHSKASARYPLRVHWRQDDEAGEAAKVLTLLERCWALEVDGMGFRPPPSDGGRCGPDERFDAFLWRGVEECSVGSFAANEETAWDDALVYMVVDPWGPYGAEKLAATVAHEFNHACQAADDWWEPQWAFEASATFVESTLFPDGIDLAELAVDLQEHPDWSLARDDDYETWFMYAGGLYLHYLARRWFQGDPGWLAKVWLACRSPAGGEDDPARNEPDFMDALDAALSRQGTRFGDSVAEFARWRWFTGERDRGQHLPGAARLAQPKAEQVRAPGRGEQRRLTLEAPPMPLGTAYLDLVGGAGATLELRLGGDTGAVRWVAQVLPGDEGRDGETLQPGPDGALRFQLGTDGRRTLVLTPLPERYDADEADEEPCSPRLVLRGR